MLACYNSLDQLSVYCIAGCSRSTSHSAVTTFQLLKLARNSRSPGQASTLSWSRLVLKDIMAGWLKGLIKEVVSGDTVVVVAATQGPAVPPEKRLTLSSLVAPRLVRFVAAPCYVLLICSVG